MARATSWCGYTGTWFIYGVAGTCGIRVSRGGNVRSQGAFTIVPEGYYHGGIPRVAFGGSNSLVVWSDGDVYGSRVSTGGAVLGESSRFTSLSGRTRNPALAFDGTNHLVVFESEHGLIDEIFGVLVNPSGNVLWTVRISSRERQSDPVVAFDGTNFLVAWKGGCAGICGARVSRSGDVLDRAGIPIWAFGLTSDAKLAMAFDGTNYLAVWEGPGQEIAFARVSPAGNVLDPDGIPVAHGVSPAVVFAGGNYLVVWLHRDSERIYGARVSPSGTVLDRAGIPISGAVNQYATPAVAFDGTNALVVWPAGAPISASRIVGARVNSAGKVLDPSPIFISRPNWCVVPGVVGLRLARAKGQIRSANCRVGRIRRVPSRRAGRVLGQGPRAGVQRPPGSPVNLVVGASKR